METNSKLCFPSILTRLPRSFAWRGLWLLLGYLSLAPAARGATTLEQSYHLMYNLQFEEARSELARWQAVQPSDPRGPVSEAASYLFSELHRLGILETQFFANNSSFRSKSQLSPNPEVRKVFDEALRRAETLAQARLSRSPGDCDALFAMALVHGLNSDYAALIEKRNLTALRMTREGSEWAEKLLAIRPDYYDAYLATGINHYIMGSLFAPVRWMLKMAGYKGDKKEGLRQLRLVADRGQLLAPFARLLLAIAHLRDNQIPPAHSLLVALRDEFPRNLLFAREVARLENRELVTGGP
ncbi:MAG: hypothetical protein AB1898_17530 [Acidobacteriota bacterium]